jgi:hypothetical protein
MDEIENNTILVIKLIIKVTNYFTISKFIISNFSKIIYNYVTVFQNKNYLVNIF